MNEKLVNLVAEIIGISAEEVSPETSRDTESQWDSMNHLRLITATEEEFSITLTMDEIENIRSFGDLKAAIVNHT